MNELTNELTAEYIPTAALIVYNLGHDNYLEVHKIENGKLMAAQPVSNKFINELAKKVHPKTESIYPYGDIPKNVIYIDQREKLKMIWYLKPSKKPLFFSKSLNINSGAAYVPGLIFCINDYTLSVYAYTGNFSNKVKIFKSPFLNTYKDGRICLGNAKVKIPKDLTYFNLMAYWDKMFFGSEFSHLQGNNTTKTNTAILWETLIQTGDVFPIEELIPTKLTIKDLKDALHR